MWEDACAKQMLQFFDDTLSMRWSVHEFRDGDFKSLVGKAFP